jgi:hypothetical protein
MKNVIAKVMILFARNVVQHTQKVEIASLNQYLKGVVVVKNTQNVLFAMRNVAWNLTVQVYDLKTNSKRMSVESLKNPLQLMERWILQSSSASQRLQTKKVV